MESQYLIKMQNTIKNLSEDILKLICLLTHRNKQNTSTGEKYQNGVCSFKLRKIHDVYGQAIVRNRVHIILHWLLSILTKNIYQYTCICNNVDTMIVKSILNRLSIEIFRFSYSKEYERNTVGINSFFLICRN